MKISQIIQETTTSGSVAPVELGFVKMQTRNPSVYGGNKVGNLLKGKKTSKPFANSLNEAAMKDLAYDLQSMKPAEFQKKYGKSREEMKAAMSKQPQKPTPPVNEADLSEQDLILVPGQGHKLKAGFIPHDKDRTDHEVEMAVSDLFSAGKNAEKIYNMVRSISEEEGLEGWVQEKIIKANDYLNTVREYLEGKQVQGVAEGGAKDRQWSNKDMERLRVATKDFDDIMASDGPDQTKHDLIKKRIQTKPMTGPKGQLPEQGVAEGAKVDRMVKHIEKSEKKLGKSEKEAENIAWATANKRGMLDNKNKKA